MKINTIFVIVAAVVLVGCRGRNDPETIAANRVNANSPEFVTDTPKGKLYRIMIDMGITTSSDRVYYFDRSNEVNINQTVKQGKTSHVETTVVIDGVEYIRKEN